MTHFYLSLYRKILAEFFTGSDPDPIILDVGMRVNSVAGPATTDRKYSYGLRSGGRYANSPGGQSTR